MIEKTSTARKILNQLDRLDALPKIFVAVLNFLLLIILGFINYKLGYEIAFSIFYVFPVGLAAWAIGRRWGNIFSLISAMLWVAIDIYSGHNYSSIIIAFWNGLVRLGFFVVITALLVEIKKVLKNEKIMGRIDHITEIPNARSFFESAEKEVSLSARKKRPLTIAYLDVDNFKEINDSLGHNKGDEVLKKIAGTIRANIRQSELVARIGGDEFVLIYPETDEKTAKNIIYVLQSRLNAAVNNILPKISFSIGVITCASGECTLQEMIRLADNRMYDSKKSGKNAASFSCVIKT